LGKSEVRHSDRYPGQAGHTHRALTAVLSEIEAGASTMDSIAAREACSKRHVNMTIWPS
jgi:hypothetical protein